MPNPQIDIHLDHERLRPIFDYHRWRHRIHLSENRIITPGYLIMPDEWEDCGLPESFKGESFLDIGANDGFYSFEAEKRGASNVVALDIY